MAKNGEIWKWKLGQKWVNIRMKIRLSLGFFWWKSGEI